MIATMVIELWRSIQLINGTAVTRILGKSIFYSSRKISLFAQMTTYYSFRFFLPKESKSPFNVYPVQSTTFTNIEASPTLVSYTAYM